MSLRIRGATVGHSSIIAPSLFNGTCSNLKVGNFCAIGRVEFHLHATIAIGDKVIISDHVRLLTGTHDINSTDFPHICRAIVVSNYVWIATGATILPGVVIGEGSVVGANAVVTKNVEPYSVVAGNPAKVVSQRSRMDFQYFPNHFFAVTNAWTK